MNTFAITNKTRSKAPTLPFQKIKEDILGKKYNLSLAFIGETRAKQLNETYRQKTYTPNVLSFPLTDTQGEIFISPRIAEREAGKFSMSKKGYVGFLFIHACLHLKGYHHGATMDTAEKKYCRKYSLR